MGQLISPFDHPLLLRLNDQLEEEERDEKEEGEEENNNNNKKDTRFTLPILGLLLILSLEMVQQARAKSDI